MNRPAILDKVSPIELSYPINQALIPIENRVWLLIAVQANLPN
jgi:hypothetical protein